MSQAGRKGTKTQYCTRLGLDCTHWHAHSSTNTHTHKSDRVRPVECVYQKFAVKRGASEVGAFACILGNHISCFRMKPLAVTHTDTVTTNANTRKSEPDGRQPGGQPLVQALLWELHSWRVIPRACVSQYPELTDSSGPKDKSSFRETVN